MENRVVHEKESVRSTAKTADEAIRQGLAELNLSLDDVEIDVIKTGRQSILGIGAEDAVVLLTPRNTSIYMSEIEDDFSEEDELFEEEELRVFAKEVLENVLFKIPIDVEVWVRTGYDLVEEGDDPPITLDVTGDDLGILIGRRGETLNALQFIVRQIISKKVGYLVPVIIDVESYRVRRRKSLQQLALRMADRVAFSKRKINLEPMTSADRRIVHYQLRDHEYIYTKSTGERDRRRVIILPKFH
ncbi:MAG: hypothetical protein B6242_03625 [Anaerolineaceae bacterium 4572_78]|nr:MAG: hypothetical protein B6242_03625 [Anaerolineaceae bacterium 4572_78]